MNFEVLNKLCFVFILLFIICSCNDEEPTAPTEENLLLNTSFENNGTFSTVGWTLPTSSDSSNDVPPNGGNYSLKLQSNAPPEEYAYIKVPVKLQYSIFKLTFWGKSTGVSSNVPGKAVLSLIRNKAEINSQSILVDQISWQSFSIQDTFNVAQGDSFIVKFSGGINQLFSAQAYFDLVQLQGIK
ncbi:MAG: hypothetical protein OQK56_04220 [Ignavibacteriaceae bacterium]|nr:hypothetical protein [Ignavibacteriaceae bacterium]MCW9064893.1 hypothetical protein [Ignavibacteriaceae bacterium]